MRRYWLAGLPMATAGLMALISGLLAGPSQAREVDDPAAASAPATPILLSGALSSVATISPDNAWAAGSASLSTSRPLIMHWNGKAWTKSGIPISANGAIGALYAVSANDVWAVGDTSGTITHPLLLHWNGHRWSRPAGVPSVAGALETVTVIGGDVWAAGEVSAGKYSYNPLVLHRIGSEWFIVPAPAADGLIFSGLAATARDSIWAIAATKAAVLPSVLLHWNGSAWRPASYPGQASQAHLYAVTAGPKGVVWAVGDYTRGNTTVPFSVRWTGKKWQLVVIPGPTTGTLFGVSPIPGGEAWAVGYRGRGLVSLRWDGKAWIPVPVPDDPSAFQLDAVSASSASNAWTLSYRFAGGGHPAGTMLIHWNGKTWT